MRGVPLVRRDRVHVDVQDLRTHRTIEGRDARLLARLAQGRVEGRRVGVFRMPARLQPAPELAVVNQQELGAVRPRDDRARRDVADRIRARERIRRRLEQAADARERLGFLGRRGRVALERGQEIGAIHAEPGVNRVA